MRHWTPALAQERIDPTLPPRQRDTGLIHPIARTMEEIAAIFGAMGCTVSDGPDVESDWFNFGALNIPAHHPARADHDTFYLPAAATTKQRPVRGHRVRRRCCGRIRHRCRSAPC